MDREAVINVLIGALLVLAFVLPIAAIVGGVWLFLRGIELSIRHFWPAAIHGEVAIFYLLLVALSSYCCVQETRRRMWTNAFLCGAIAATLTLTWSVSPQEIFPAAFLIFLLPPHAQTSRLEFAARASAISLAFVLNSGLLGHGLISGVAWFVFIIAFARYSLLTERPYRPGWPGLFSLSNKSAG